MWMWRLAVGMAHSAVTGVVGSMRRKAVLFSPSCANRKGREAGGSFLFFKMHARLAVAVFFFLSACAVAQLFVLFIPRSIQCFNSEDY